MAVGGSGEDELYEEQWKACAGPLVDVPREGQRVFYFPQGHMEQVSETFLFTSSQFSLSHSPFCVSCKNSLSFFLSRKFMLSDNGIVGVLLVLLN